MWEPPSAVIDLQRGGCKVALPEGRGALGHSACKASTEMCATLQGNAIGSIFYTPGNFFNPTLIGEAITGMPAGRKLSQFTKSPGPDGQPRPVRLRQGGAQAHAPVVGSFFNQGKWAAVSVTICNIPRACAPGTLPFKLCACNMLVQLSSLPDTPALCAPVAGNIMGRLMRGTHCSRCTMGGGGTDACARDIVRRPTWWPPC